MKLRDALHRSFLERNQKLIGFIGVLAVMLGTAFSLLLSGGFFQDTYTVRARFADAAGLRSSDDVQVAGLDAGSIGSVEVQDGAVVVELKIDKDIEMPRDANAEIVIETLLGRKAVRLDGGSSSEMLRDGDEIPLENTRTPVELLDLANRSRPLLDRSDPQALQDFMDQITAVTQGKSAQVSTLISGLADVTDAVDSRKRELSRLLESLNTLGATFAEKDETLVSLIDNLNVVLTNLSERRDDVVRLLESTDSASHATADLVRRNRPRLDRAMTQLHDTLEVIDRHQVDIAATISYLHDSVQGYSSVVYSAGGTYENRWANIFVQSLGPLGIDAFFGPCGTFDNALDDLLGEDPRPCEDRAEYGDGYGGGGGEGGSSGSGDGSPQTQEPPEQVAERERDDGLGGDVGDLIDNVTGDSTLTDDLRGLLP
jgi:phospholipid/cholesterol/gamma-HCH transport system substrate-binding protein